MQAGELLSFCCSSSSSSSSSYATATVYDDEDSMANMKLGVSANSRQAEQMERELESLSMDLEGKLEVEEEEEFSFVCGNPDGSPISAEDAFHKGQIRAVYPVFNREVLLVDRSPLRKVFVEKRDTLELEEGTYCEWSPPSTSELLVKKSNSTGFSKLWRFRDFMTMHRSSSDGKDAFVFLQQPTKNNSSSSSSSGPKLKPQTVSSAHETHYVRSRAQKQLHKHRSYLPYRQDLLGFFSNVNGLTKNVHPF